ncbi:MAG: hypothetical protein HYR76_12160 [Ignavibacteria bacterium]|nr:hypothetical protein [Ignavibacteria bacterium]MBI3765628.1 hypothetical protein [Ignavibacteriales bacterium]
MITLLIFYIHTIAAVTVYTRRWQESDWKEGLLAVGFLVLIFGVGWSMSTFVLKLFVNEKGFGLWLDRDALSLLLLTVMEGVFYYMQMRRKKRKSFVAVRRSGG